MESLIICYHLSILFLVESYSHAAWVQTTRSYVVFYPCGWWRVWLPGVWYLERAKGVDVDFAQKKNMRDKRGLVSLSFSREAQSQVGMSCSVPFMCVYGSSLFAASCTWCWAFYFYFYFFAISFASCVCMDLCMYNPLGPFPITIP